MNNHADKTQENKSQSFANRAAQKQSTIESSLQFVDNRPEVIVWRKLQEMADNSPHVKQLKTIQIMADNSLQVRESKKGSVVQLKPKDFKRKHTLSVDRDGAVTNAEANRAAIPVSYPMNALIYHKIIDVSEVVGGHLFKREYGGPDDFSNVVTWSHDAEDNFTLYENAYLNDARDDAVRKDKGAHDRVISCEAKFSTNKINVNRVGAGDEDKSPEAKEARHKISKLLAGGIESIPDKVKVTAQGRQAWEKSGKAEFVSGDLFPVVPKVTSLYNQLKDGNNVDRIDNAINKIDEM